MSIKKAKSLSGMSSFLGGNSVDEESSQDKLIKAFKKLGVPNSHISTILEHQKVSGQTLIEVIREIGFPESEVVAQAMSIAYSKEYVDSLIVDNLSPDDFPNYDELLKYAVRTMVPVAYDKERKVVKIAISEESQASEIRTNYNIDSKYESVFASQETIENVFLRVFSRTKEEALDALYKMNQVGVNSPSSGQHRVFLDALIKHACYSGVSDIHFVPLQKTSMIKFRVDGDLFEFCAITSDHMERLMNLIKREGNINEDVQDTQESSYSFPDSMKEVSDRYTFRVQLSKTIRGLAAVFRILDSRSNAASVDAIGFDEETKQNLMDLTEKSAGLILITGPTGSGKTTTLYSLLKRIDPMRMAIHTVENPVEYRYGAWNQHEIGRGSNNSSSTEGQKWEVYFKGLLRNDIDVGLLGEVRDRSTADAALQLSNTGHLVFTTLHTNSASRAITRLSEMQVNMGAFSDVGLGILAQRLVKKLCVSCKSKVSIEDSEKTLNEIQDVLKSSYSLMADTEKSEILKKFNISKIEDLDKHIIYENVDLHQSIGCEHCNNTGYKGRQAVYELLMIDRNIRKLISKCATGDEIMETVPMTKKMWGVGISHIMNGVTTLEELRRRVNKED